VTRKIERLYGWPDGEAALTGEFRDGRLITRIDGVEHHYEILSADSGFLRLRDGDGAVLQAFVAVREKKTWVQIDGRVHVLEQRTRRRRADGGGKGALGPIDAPMFGTIRKILVEPGAAVEEGQGLVVIEAMKMELTLRAPLAARVGEVCCREGTQVDQGARLVVLTALDGPEGPPKTGKE
jgi:biotin carboxyl carrier protein